MYYVWVVWLLFHHRAKREASVAQGKRERQQKREENLKARANKKRVSGCV